MDSSMVRIALGVLVLLSPNFTEVSANCGTIYQDWTGCLSAIDKVPNCDKSKDCPIFGPLLCKNQLINAIKFADLQKKYQKLLDENQLLKGYNSGNDSKISDLQTQINNISPAIPKLKAALEKANVRGDVCRKRDLYIWEKTQANPQAFTYLKEVISCEYFYSNLECPIGTHIKILEATYGRLDTYTCSYQPQAPNDCYANRTLVMQVVQNKCPPGSRTCTVQCNHQDFGDPCINVYKNMEILYACETD